MNSVDRISINFRLNYKNKNVKYWTYWKTIKTNLNYCVLYTMERHKIGKTSFSLLLLIFYGSVGAKHENWNNLRSWMMENNFIHLGMEK